MWLYKGKEINSLEDFGENPPFGFIYIVTHTPTGKKIYREKTTISYI